MSIRLQERMPHPFSFGITGRRRLAIEPELSNLKKPDAVLVEDAKKSIAQLRTRYPEMRTTEEEITRLKPQDIKGLYAHPTDALIYTSPHNIRHFAAVDILSVVIGKYANALLIRNGEDPLNIPAMRFAAWTHDGYRSRFDSLETVANYQLHGIRAGRHVQETLRRGGLPIPDARTLRLVQEIDTYHDVDKRPYSLHSPEKELFTTIDKLEIVRLFHPSQHLYKLPIISHIIQFFSKKRMRAYEGSRDTFMGVMQEFLPITAGLHRLSQQKIASQRKEGKQWKDIDQYAAVLDSAKELGLITVLY